MSSWYIRVWCGDGAVGALPGSDIEGEGSVPLLGINGTHTCLGLVCAWVGIVKC